MRKTSLSPQDVKFDCIGLRLFLFHVLYFGTIRKVLYYFFRTWVFSKENEKLADISPLMLNGPDSSKEKL